MVNLYVSKLHSGLRLQIYDRGRSIIRVTPALARAWFTQSNGTLDNKGLAEATAKEQRS